VGDIPVFVVWTDHALYRDRIVHMGWHPSHDGSFVRPLSPSATIDLSSRTSNDISRPCSCRVRGACRPVGRRSRAVP
jgi:hypothetical protein